MDLTVTIIQTNLYWENPTANRKHFGQLFKQIRRTDLILLPETFSTAFSMNSKSLGEEMNGETMRWLARSAVELNTVIAGSLIIKEEGKIFNRFLFVSPKGEIEFYDKRHLFRMGEEHNHFTAGEERLIYELKGWKICPQICYDLRFPVWSRKQNEVEYDLLVYAANWPEARKSAWEKLLYARAIENQTYVAAINRIGEDGNGVNCAGGSSVIDPKGDLIWNAQESEAVKTITFSKKSLADFRKKFPLGLDADNFEIK